MSRELIVMKGKNLLFILLILVLIVAAILILNLDKKSEGTIVKVGATPVPHAEILEYVKPLLAERGITLEIVEFTDYVTPNLALNDGSIDANFFQHQPYLDSFNRDHNIELATAAKIHVEPFGLYSEKIQSIDELPDGGTIAVPNDPSNEGRALLLLANNGYITLEAENELEATPYDIQENSQRLEFEELEAAQLPRILPDVTAAFINTNYALEAGLNPLEDALIIEGSESPYANILVVRKESLEDEQIKVLVEVMTSEPVREF